jgi:hypothetical protein
LLLADICRIRVDGLANDWFLVPPIAEDEKTPSRGSGSDIRQVDMAQDPDNVYFMIKLNKKSNTKYNYQLQIHNIKDNTGRDFGATLGHVNNSERNWQGRIVEDWWEEKDNHTLYKGVSPAGVKEAVELKIPLSVFGELADVQVDFVFQKLDKGGNALDRVDKFRLRLHEKPDTRGDVIDSTGKEVTFLRIRR